MAGSVESRFERLCEIEQRTGELRERYDRLAAGAMLAGSTQAEVRRAAQLAELARVRAAEAVRRVVTSRINAANAHELVARTYELAGTGGSARDFQAQAIRHRLLAAADRAAAEAMAASVSENLGAGSRHAAGAGTPAGQDHF